MRRGFTNTISESRRRRRRARRGAEPSAAPVAIAMVAVREPDEAVARAREAGGPIDRASYSCECGYQFCAPVSTTVHCPHCGVGQAW